MSEQLNAHPVLLDFLADDLGSPAATGRYGLTAESALRCALLKHYRQLTYDELAFHLLDSASFQALPAPGLDAQQSRLAGEYRRDYRRHLASHQYALVERGR